MRWDNSLLERVGIVFVPALVVVTLAWLMAFHLTKGGNNRSVAKRQIVLWSSGLVFLWLGSAFFLLKILTSGKPAKESMPSISDLTAIFFGASSLAMIMFSLLLAAAAMIEWQSLKGEVGRLIEAAVNDATNKNEEHLQNLGRELRGEVETVVREARGRSFAVLGYVMGEDSVDPAHWRACNVERLKEAIQHCRQGYNFLKGTNLPAEFMALNNLLEFSCVLEEADEKPRSFVQEAYRLKEAAEKHEDSPGAASLLLTFARTVLVFSKKEAEMTEAAKKVNDLLHADLDFRQRRAAEQLARLFEKCPPAAP